MLGIKGFGSDGLSLLLLAILIFDKIIIPLYINWRKDRKLTLKSQKIQLNPSGNIKPGDGETCKKNSGAIIKLDTKLKEVCKSLEKIEKNNREDHKEIFNKIDQIKNNRR